MEENSINLEGNDYCSLDCLSGTLRNCRVSCLPVSFPSPLLEIKYELSHWNDKCFSENHGYTRKSILHTSFVLWGNPSVAVTPCLQMKPLTALTYSNAIIYRQWAVKEAEQWEVDISKCCADSGRSCDWNVRFSTVRMTVFQCRSGLMFQIFPLL